ncbi:hypothetical protein CC78DRAFT_528444, partial [Lojkania enalia]
MGQNGTGQDRTGQDRTGQAPRSQSPTRSVTSWWDLIQPTIRRLGRPLAWFASSSCVSAFRNRTARNTSRRY